MKNQVYNKGMLTELARLINEDLHTSQSNKRIELTFESGKVSLQRLEISESKKGPDKTFVFIKESYRTMFVLLTGIMQGVTLFTKA